MIKKRRLLIIYSVTIIFIIIFFFIPLPYYSAFPGEIINMGKVVLLENDNISSGHFFAISVNIYENPYSQKVGLTKNSFKISLFIFVISKLSPTVELNKFPAGYENITSEEIKSYQYQLMNESQEIAINIASEYLNMNKSGFNVSFGVLAGSSGRLAITLELIQQQGDIDLLKGRMIAATGEIAANGTIQRIGRPQLKLHTAKKEDIDLVLIPEDNRKDISYEQGIEVLYVANLTDAISKLI